MKLKANRILKTASFAMLPLALAVGCAGNGGKTTASIKPVENETVVQNDSQAEKSLDDMFKGISSNLMSESTISETAQVENETLANEPATNETFSSKTDSAVQTEETSDGFMQVNLTQPENIMMSEPEKSLFHFSANQYQLNEDDIEILQQHAAYLMINPGLRLVIEAHSDAQGSEANNYKISGKRADKVVEILVNHGVPKDLIIVNNYGESFPLHDEKNWDENRRVEIRYQEAGTSDDLLVSTH